MPVAGLTRITGLHPLSTARGFAYARVLWCFSGGRARSVREHRGIEAPAEWAQRVPVTQSFFDPVEFTSEVWLDSQALHDRSDAECRTILNNCRLRVRSGWSKQCRNSAWPLDVVDDSFRPAQSGSRYPRERCVYALPDHGQRRLRSLPLRLASWIQHRLDVAIIAVEAAGCCSGREVSHGGSYMPTNSRVLVSSIPLSESYCISADCRPTRLPLLDIRTVMNRRIKPRNARFIRIRLKLRPAARKQIRQHLRSRSRER